MHTCLVLLSGHAYLTGLESMLGICNPCPHKLFLPTKRASPKIWLGGVLNSPLPYPDPSQHLALFLTSMPSRMQALALPLPLSYKIDGELGDSSQGGKTLTEHETSDGLRPSVSSSSSEPSLSLQALEGTLRSSVTTKESSNGGGIQGAGTKRLILSSDGFMPSLNNSTTHSLSSQLMFPVTTTWQTPLPEVSTPLLTSCFPKSNFQLVSTGSLSMQHSLFPHRDQAVQTRSLPSHSCCPH